MSQAHDAQQKECSLHISVSAGCTRGENGKHAQSWPTVYKQSFLVRQNSLVAACVGGSITLHAFTHNTPRMPIAVQQMACRFQCHVMLKATIVTLSLPGSQSAVTAGAGSGRGTKRKPQPTVRERLAKKLLSGRARHQTLGEVESAADERFQEVNSNRWQATRFP